MDAIVAVLIVVAVLGLLWWTRKEWSAKNPALRDYSTENFPVVGITGQICSKPGVYRSTKDLQRGVVLHEGELFPPGVTNRGDYKSETWELVVPVRSRPRVE